MQKQVLIPEVVLLLRIFMSITMSDSNLFFPCLSSVLDARIKKHPGVSHAIEVVFDIWHATWSPSKTASTDSVGVSYSLRSHHISKRRERPTNVRPVARRTFAT